MGFVPPQNGSGRLVYKNAHDDAKAAIANYNKAIELSPKYVDAWVRKGITLYNEKDYYEAETCLNEAVRLSPSSFKAVYNRGKIRLALENTEGASRKGTY